MLKMTHHLLGSNIIQESRNYDNRNDSLVWEKPPYSHIDSILSLTKHFHSMYLSLHMLTHAQTHIHKVIQWSTVFNNKRLETTHVYELEN